LKLAAFAFFCVALLRTVVDSVVVWLAESGRGVVVWMGVSVVEVYTDESGAVAWGDEDCVDVKARVNCTFGEEVREARRSCCVLICICNCIKVPLSLHLYIIKDMLEERKEATLQK
jgi:hypothetical protein